MVPALAAEQPTGEPVTGTPAIVEAGHVSPALKPVPVTDIDAPTGPEAGERVTTCGIMYRVAVADTGVVSVTVIASVTGANVRRTVKEAAAVSVKSAATHTGTANGEPVTDAPVIVHAPTVPKLVPVMVTVSPTRAGLAALLPGVSVCEICGTTLKVFVAVSRRFPWTVNTAAACAGVPAVPTMNEPVTTPPLIVQVGLVAMFVPPVMVHVVSVIVNPLPETIIVSPPLPLVGENVTRG